MVEALNDPMIRNVAQGALAAAFLGVLIFISRRPPDNQITDLADRKGLAELADGKAAPSAENLLSITMLEVMIRDVEKVNVVFSSSDTNNSERVFKPYSYTAKLSDDATVADLFRTRLSQYEADGLKPVVTNWHQHAVPRGSKLREVRSTFIEGDD